MNVSKIEKKGKTYFVTKTPNFIQKLFGLKEKTEQYKWEGEVFTRFEHLKVFYKSTGEALSWNDKICKILNNFEHSFCLM